MNQTKNIRRCGNCGYYKKDKKTSTFNCHRYPPTVVGAGRINPISKLPETGLLAVLTQVDQEHWCGEFIPRSDPNEIPRDITNR